MLSGRDREVLTFEEINWVHSGRKQNDTRDTFGFDTARYYSNLLGLIHDANAVRAISQLTKRMLERSEAHSRAARRRASLDDD